MFKYAKNLVLTIGLIFSPFLNASTAGDVSDSLFGPTLIATRLAIFACYIIGVGLILAAGVQYKQHRQSPKLVPLTTPILLLLIGLGLVGLPYISTISQNTFSAIEQDKRDNPYADPQKGRLPLPPLHGQDGRNPYSREGDETSNSRYNPDKSHWSNDPEYN